MIKGRFFKFSAVKLLFFLCGFFILFPFGVELKTTEFFIFQLLDIILLFCIGLYLKPRFRFYGFLDQLFLVTIIFCLLSYIINFYSFALSGNFTLELFRFKSFIVTLTLYFSYLTGKVVFSFNSSQIKQFFNGILTCFLFEIIFFFYKILELRTYDMMQLRVTIEQRIPLVLSYLSVFTFVFALGCKKNRLIYFILFSGGVIIVIFSFTRAAYIQIAASLIFLALYKLRHKPVKVILLSLVIISSVFFSFSRSNYSTQLKTRIRSFTSLSLLGKDVSISYRFQQWNALISDMNTHPIKLFFGYGQLGASYIKTNVNKIESSSAHSQYIDILIREGVFGLLLFLTFFISIIYIGIFKNDLFPEEFKLIIFANSICLIGVFFYGLFHESIRYFQFGYYYMFFAGFLSFLSAKNRSKLNEQTNIYDDNLQLIKINSKK